MAHPRWEVYLAFYRCIAPMNGTLTWEFLPCFIKLSSEEAFCVFEIQFLNYARCISDGSWGILKIQLHLWAGGGKGGGTSTFFALILTVFKKHLAIERYKMLSLTERFGVVQPDVLD